MQYFADTELQSPDTHIVKLAPGFASALPALREAWKKPMKVNSCCRSTQHNKIVGGKENSFHLYEGPGHEHGTCAADISMFDSAERGAFVALAWSMGFSVGINKAFIHVDTRTQDYNWKQVLFLY